MDKKGRIDNKLITIVPVEKLGTMSDIKYNYTGIEVDDLVLPIRAKNDDRPGAYLAGPIIKLKRPDKDEIENYIAGNNIIDFSNTKNMQECIEKNKRVRELEANTLTTYNGEEVTRFPISPNDTSEMVAYKTALNSKNFNINKYEHRFDGSFNNDKRLLFKESISLSKLKSTAKAFDLKLTLTIEDKDDTVPNPIGKKISVVINGDDEDDNYAE